MVNVSINDGFFVVVGMWLVGMFACCAKENVLVCLMFSSECIYFKDSVVCEWLMWPFLSLNVTGNSSSRETHQLTGLGWTEAFDQTRMLYVSLTENNRHSYFAAVIAISQSQPSHCQCKGQTQQSSAQRHHNLPNRCQCHGQRQRSLKQRRHILLNVSVKVKHNSHRHSAVTIFPISVSVKVKDSGHRNSAVTHSSQCQCQGQRQRSSKQRCHIFPNVSVKVKDSGHRNSAVTFFPMSVSRSKTAVIETAPSHSSQCQCKGQRQGQDDPNPVQTRQLTYDSTCDETIRPGIVGLHGNLLCHYTT